MRVSFCDTDGVNSSNDPDDSDESEEEYYFSHKPSIVNQVEDGSSFINENNDEEDISEISVAPQFPSVPHSTPQLQRRSCNHSHSCNTNTNPPFILNTLDAKKNALNHMFGFPKWKGRLCKQTIEEHSDFLRSLDKPLKEIQRQRETSSSPFLSNYIGNIVYILLLGWWMALIYLLAAVIMYISVLGGPYASLCLNLSGYFLWPFGKVLERDHQSSDIESREYHVEEASQKTNTNVKETNPLLPKPVLNVESQVPGTTDVAGYILWMFICFPFLAIAHVVVTVITWESVVMIPIAKMNIIVLEALVRFPLAVKVNHSLKGPQGVADVVVCIYQASNIYYYKYSAFGMSILMINLLPFVVLSLVLGYVDCIKASPYVIFSISLLSIIPLAYYIGCAISSIAAQSSGPVGAVLNATFGSIVELFIYYVSIKNGFSNLVKAALTGSLLGMCLLVPGLCMIVGGIRRKNQKFNAASASVSSMLLFVSIVGAYTPSFFYKVYGEHSLSCSACVPANFTTAGLLSCEGCHYTQEHLDKDKVFFDDTRPLINTVACILPVSYIAGLVYTLKTHRSIYELEGIDGKNVGHQGPEWSRITCAIILLVSTVLMALISELVVNNIEPVIVATGISQQFMGATVLALVPNISEIVNGIQFAFHDHIDLSIEMCTSVAVQIALLQMPILVLIVTLMDLSVKTTFLLLFPDLQLWSVVFSVLVMNYTMSDGRSNYFDGTALLSIWAIFISMFYYAPY